MVASSVLGFPRIGLSHLHSTYFTNLPLPGTNREIKKAVEAYWAGKISSDDLDKASAGVKKASWTTVKEKGVTFVPR